LATATPWNNCTTAAAAAIKDIQDEEAAITILERSLLVDIEDIIEEEEDDNSNDIDDSDDSKSSGGSSSLQFVGHTIFTSDPLPFPKSNGLLMEFFTNPDHRRHLLLGEGAPEPFEDGASLPAVQSIARDQRTAQLLERWAGEAEAARIKSCGKMAPPDFDQDELLLVKSSGIPFLLGTKILVESIVSAKVVTTQHSFPGYQFLLLQDTVRIDGPRPLLWLYERIMSFKDDNKQMTHSYSMVTVQPTTATTSEEDDISTDQPPHMTMTSESTIEINIDIPQVMIQMLPLSRETANRQGSAAIQKSFEVKGKPGLDNFIQAYRKWYDTTQQKQWWMEGLHRPIQSKAKQNTPQIGTTFSSLQPNTLVAPTVVDE